MEDIQTSLLTLDKPLASEYVLVFLDALAHIHATFWNDRGLVDPMLGLMDTSTLLECFSPLNAQRYAHYTNTPLPTVIIGGWDVLTELLEPEVYVQIRKLIEDPKPLLDAVAPFPRTLTHGDYRPANVAHDGHTCIAFDWQLSAYSLLIFDLIWFVRGDSVMATISVEEAIEIYRQQYEVQSDIPRISRFLSR